MVRLNDSVSMDVAALAEPLSVVLHAYRRAQLKPAARVLVLGAGAVGLLACTLAKASGATTVVAVDIEQAKLDFAKQMNWVTGTYALPKGPRVSGFEALDVAKSGWEGLKGSEAVTGVEGLAEGFDAVFECTGVESCMQLAPMVSRLSLVSSILLIPRPRYRVGKSSMSEWEQPTSSSLPESPCSEKST